MTRAVSRTTIRAATTALLVLALALGACSGEDGAAVDPPSAEPSARLTVEAGDLYFEPEQLAALAGEVTVTLRNVGSVVHDFVIEELGDEVVAFAAARSTDTGTVTLEAGTYTYSCSIPGHRNAMEGTLVVS